MRKKSIILGSVLLLVGGVALLWGLTEIRMEQEQIALYQSKYSKETNDFMKQYSEWLRLPADERTAFPLLLDEEGNTKTRAQLKQEQRERLKGDLEKLASGRTDVHPFADVLYGQNWLSEVEAYKKRKELDECILMGSVVCTSMGGLIYAWWLLLGTGRLIVRGMAGLKQRRAASKADSLEVEDDQTDPMDQEDTPPEEQTSPEQDQRPKHSKVLAKSNWGHWSPAQRDPEITAEVNQIKRISNEVDRIDALLSDEKTTRVGA